MNQKWQSWLWAAGVAGSLGLGAAATAQTSSFQPFKNLFGSKTSAETKASDQRTVDVNRTMEIQVELAWLGDRTTFPYYLEAHVKGSTMEVKGYVPTKTVRDQAINLAKLNTTLSVTDAMKEHSSLAFHPVQRSPEQLKSSVQTTLREDFPGMKLTVQCQSDGTVQLAGSVKTLEQKLALSKALRRLHGCSSVVNNTVVGNMDIAQQPVQPAKTAPKTAPVGTNAPVVPASMTTGPNMTNAPASVPANNPYESRGVVVVSGQEASGAVPIPGTAPAPTPAPQEQAPKALPGTANSSALLKKKIEATIPGAHHVTVTFTSKKDVRVECTIRSGEDFDTVAGQIYSLREFDPYKVDLRIMLPQPEQK